MSFPKPSQAVLWYVCNQKKKKFTIDDDSLAIYGYVSTVVYVTKWHKLKIIIDHLHACNDRSCAQGYPILCRKGGCLHFQAIND